MEQGVNLLVQFPSSAAIFFSHTTAICRRPRQILRENYFYK